MARIDENLGSLEWITGLDDKELASKFEDKWAGARRQAKSYLHHVNKSGAAAARKADCLSFPKHSRIGRRRSQT